MGLTSQKWRTKAEMRYLHLHNLVKRYSVMDSQFVSLLMAIFGIICYLSTVKYPSLMSAPGWHNDSIFHGYIMFLTIRTFQCRFEGVFTQFFCLPNW